ncbi:MAG TPA: hypothetical protein PLV68_11790, partial [Ilumatobacteraceae bacterium]|nr:hypothetical protein [Ilumatobacteraceae bacterium]
MTDDPARPRPDRASPSLSPSPPASMGWSDWFEQDWDERGRVGTPARVVRLDRGWSSLLTELGAGVQRVRNIGADVAVGDWV